MQCGGPLLRSKASKYSRPVEEGIPTSFGTPTPSCFQADDRAIQRTNTWQCLPVLLTHLRKRYNDGFIGYTEGTEDQHAYAVIPGLSLSVQFHLVVVF